MIYLLVVSLIWAFSFGIIKTNLTNLDPNFVSFIRLFLALITFSPFLRIKRLKRKIILQFILIGLLQYGLMYLAYIYSFQYLHSYEIALFTIFTPLYIALINDLLDRKFHKTFFITAILSICGAAIIEYTSIVSPNFLKGFLLVQISNISFAAGQLFYTRLKKKINDVSHLSLFGLLYFGAVLLTGSISLVTTDFSGMVINADQILSIIYLGVIASGVAFFLWNIGATKVNAGTLAIFNNLKIPLAIVVALVIFGESGDLASLVIGGFIIAVSLYINEKYHSIK